MTAAVAMLSYTARRAVDAIHYKYQISAAARPALTRSLVHSAPVYNASALAYLSPSTVSIASC